MRFRHLRKRVSHVVHRALAKKVHHAAHPIKHESKPAKPGKAKENPVQKSYYLKVHSRRLPFAVERANFEKIVKCEKLLEEFVRFVEKKFDVIWYIGADYLEDDIYERFMFHNGGFMEISLNGTIRCFFAKDKIEKIRKAIHYANRRMQSEHLANMVDREIKTGQKLISIKDSLFKEGIK
jgi:hypothetical protein